MQSTIGHPHCSVMSCRFDTGTLKSFQEYKLQEAARRAAQGRSAQPLLHRLMSCTSIIPPAFAAAAYSSRVIIVVAEVASFSQQYFHNS